MAELQKAPAAKPAPEVDKHEATVTVQNVHDDFIDMKHQKLAPKGIGLATVAEQEALHMYLKVVK